MSYEVNNAGITTWGTNASGGEITVNSLYDLRDALDRIAASIDFSPEYDGAISNSNVKGRASLFEFDADNNLISSTNITESDLSYNNWQHHLYSESPLVISINQDSTKNRVINNLINKSESIDAYNPNNWVIGFDLTSVNSTGLLRSQVSVENGTYNSIEYADQDVLISLTDSFWDNLANLKNSDTVAPENYFLEINPALSEKPLMSMIFRAPIILKSKRS